MKCKECEWCLETLSEVEQFERCERGACLTKDRVIHEGKIVCRYCLKSWEPCEHPKMGVCSDCDTANLKTV